MSIEGPKSRRNCNSNNSKKLDAFDVSALEKQGQRNVNVYVKWQPARKTTADLCTGKAIQQNGTMPIEKSHDRDRLIRPRLLDTLASAT